MERKYSEEVVRYPAVTDEGKPCEVLERITWGREVRADGSLGEAELVNRRFDLKNGQALNRISDQEFEDDETGALVRLRG